MSREFTQIWVKQIFHKIKFFRKLKIERIKSSQLGYFDPAKYLVLQILSVQSVLS